MNKKFYEATEVEIISVLAESIITSSDGRDADPDTPDNWSITPTL